MHTKGNNKSLKLKILENLKSRVKMVKLTSPMGLFVESLINIRPAGHVFVNYVEFPVKLQSLKSVFKDIQKPEYTETFTEHFLNYPECQQ